MYIKGIQHIGLSVANLERTIHFYGKGLGMELLGQSTFAPGKYDGKYDGKYERIMALPGATGRGALIGVGNLKLELFEFSYPVPKPAEPNPPVSNHGISHFCLEVTDLEQVYAQLQTAGASFHCPPLDFGGKLLATYARDPDGNAFELIQYLPER